MRVGAYCIPLTVASHANRLPMLMEHRLSGFGLQRDVESITLPNVARCDTIASKHYPTSGCKQVAWARQMFSSMIVQIHVQKRKLIQWNKQTNHTNKGDSAGTVHALRPRSTMFMPTCVFSQCLHILGGWKRSTKRQGCLAQQCTRRETGIRARVSRFC